MGRGRIRLTVKNSSGYVLKRKTWPVRGRFRLQMNAAARVLAVLAGIRELHDGHLEAEIELVNLGKAELFESIVKTFSPIPVRIKYVREVVEEVR